MKNKHLEDVIKQRVILSNNESNTLWKVLTTRYPEEDSYVIFEETFFYQERKINKLRKRIKFLEDEVCKNLSAIQPGVL